MERTAYAALALLALVYIILGGWLARVWGINPSRGTAYAERTGKRRGGWLGLLGAYAAALAFLQGMAFSPIWQGADSPAAFAPPLVLMLSGGTISMLTLFVSVRHEGQSLPQIAMRRHGAWLGRGMYALCAMSMALCAAALVAILPAVFLGRLRLKAVPEQMVAYALLMLFGLCAALPGGVCAPRLRSERHIRRVGLGGVLLVGAVCLLGLLPSVRDALALRLPVETERCVGGVLCAFAALILAYLSCVSAKGLFARRMLLTRRKPKSEILAPLGALALIALLTRVGYGYLMLLGGALGFAYAMLSLIVCVLWLDSVGRGLFFRK